ncbi:hypothetical protein HNP38_003434 [Chryseobacterium defluvii]|uniref:Uncharacterized protein n=1 Tax=Chryseobacterium defluvii TaxID=160396 RepID=A0A840KKA3_9FLAO|nr:hypothetical protein [Chryseobacterium defluvii]MBB4808094.1 hypothetical protein [Chryseobacterium defluvii]
MKKLLTLISVIGLVMVSGQKISDYKYVSVPDYFPTFKADYDLKNALTKLLKGKKYAILPGDRQQWSSEAKQNPCNVLHADIINDSGFLRNKVTLQLKDCNNKVVLTSKGSSSIKEYIEGYQDALKQSLVAVPVSNPVEITNTTVTQTETIETETVNEVKETSSVSSVEKKAERYTNGKLNLQKIQIDNSQFILADSNSSVPYATFKATTKKDVFRVKLANGDSTIGYYEKGNIVVEIPQSNGEYAKEVFSGK